MPLDRVLLDTNVLVSAVAFSGNEHRLIKLAMDRRFKPVLSDYIVRETIRVVEEKFPDMMVRLIEILALLQYELVPEPSAGLLAVAAKIVRDKEDEPILASILLAKPDFVVTGDKDLLTDEVRAIAPVCRCAEYLQRLSTEN